MQYRSQIAISFCFGKNEIIRHDEICIIVIIIITHIHFGGTGQLKLENSMANVTFYFFALDLCFLGIIL